MKKLLLIFLLLPLLIKAQMPFPVDTTPVYRYLFTGDSVNFINTEYIVRQGVLSQGGSCLIWAYPAIDTTTHLIYACETPDIIRFINIPELAPIKNDIIAFAQGTETLAQLKEAAALSTIPLGYKQLINFMQRVNVKLYRTNFNFKNFK